MFNRLCLFLRTLFLIFLSWERTISLKLLKTTIRQSMLSKDLILLKFCHLLEIKYLFSSPMALLIKPHHLINFQKRISSLRQIIIDSRQSLSKVLLYMIFMRIFIFIKTLLSSTEVSFYSETMWSSLLILLQSKLLKDSFKNKRSCLFTS